MKFWVQPVILACVQDPQYAALAEVLGNERLASEDFRTREGRLPNRDEINNLLNAELPKWDTADLVARLQAEGVPCGPVNTFDRALADEQVLARNMVVETTAPNGQKFKMPGNPLKLSGTPAEQFEGPPLLGQHTREIYKSLLNLDDASLDALYEKGVI